MGLLSKWNGNGLFKMYKRKGLLFADEKVNSVTSNVKLSANSDPFSYWNGFREAMDENGFEVLDISIEDSTPIRDGWYTNDIRYTFKMVYRSK